MKVYALRIKWDGKSHYPNARYNIVDHKEIGTLRFVYADRIISWRKYSQLCKALWNAYGYFHNHDYSVIMVTESGLVEDYRTGVKYSNQAFCPIGELYDIY